MAAPTTTAELLDRAEALAGLTLAELALRLQQTLPRSLAKAKGFMGQLMEIALGATASSLPEPDFQHLGIELKTLPLNANGAPRESTYVCTAPLTLSSEIESWENSRVRKKLAHVLFIPIEADPALPLPLRRIGMPLLWHLDPTTEAILRQDWEELTHILHLGQIANLSAKIGMYLQIRPKAAHSRILNVGINEEGEAVLQNPKGFYLRTRFTQQILAAHYCKSSI